MTKKSVVPDYKKPETIKVDANIDSVSCDGGSGPLGHPLVYYSFEKQDMVECMYCDRVFIKKASK